MDPKFFRIWNSLWRLKDRNKWPFLILLGFNCRSQFTWIRQVAETSLDRFLRNPIIDFEHWNEAGYQNLLHQSSRLNSLEEHQSLASPLIWTKKNNFDENFGFRIETRFVSIFFEADQRSFRWSFWASILSHFVELSVSFFKASVGVVVSMYFAEANAELCLY